MVAASAMSPLTTYPVSISEPRQRGDVREAHQRQRGDDEQCQQVEGHPDPSSLSGDGGRRGDPAARRSWDEASPATLNDPSTDRRPDQISPGRTRHPRLTTWSSAGVFRSEALPWV